MEGKPVYLVWQLYYFNSQGHINSFVPFPFHSGFGQLFSIHAIFYNTPFSRLVSVLCELKSISANHYSKSNGKVWA